MGAKVSDKQQNENPDAGRRDVLFCRSCRSLSCWFSHDPRLHRGLPSVAIPSLHNNEVRASRRRNNGHTCFHAVQVEPRRYFHWQEPL